MISAAGLQAVAGALPVRASAEQWFGFLVILLALGAGLAAAYGRERQAKRVPDRQWWFNRLLAMPVLAISSAAAADAFQLSPSLTAFTAAMMSLSGYDALCLLERRWRLKLQEAGVAVEPDAAAVFPCGPAPTQDQDGGQP